MSADSALARLLVWQSDAPREINDFEARTLLGLQEADFVAIQSAMPGVIEFGTLTEIECPNCGMIVHLPPGTPSVYCANCRRLWTTGQFPSKTYSVRRETCIELLTKRIANELTESGFHVELSEDPLRLTTSANDVPIGISILPKEVRLKDFYVLRGSLKDPTNSIAVLVAPSFEDILQFYTRNSPESILVSTFDWLENGIAWARILSERLQFIAGLRRIEEAVGEKFTELKIADDVSMEIATLLKQLPLLSLQIAEGSASLIGNKFQRYVITILNAFTPFKILPVGGKNQEDGVMRFYFTGVNRKPRWYPVGIKSFKGEFEGKKGCYPLKEAMLQLRKYARAYTQEESVVREVDVPSYILMAHDFDLSDNDVQSEVSAFQDDTGLPLKLWPVSTTLKLVEGFVKLHPELVPNYVLERNLQQSGTYLNSKWVDDLLEKLREHQKQERTDLKIRRVRKHLEERHA